jgi:hypothetical protein
MQNAFDLVGDIHGHAHALRGLLAKLGYSTTGGHYSHPEGRRVIFLGDFIDRGPLQFETLAIVKSMLESGNALSVMGNHEFNALAFHTQHPHYPGKWLRPHSEKNMVQHEAFLGEFNSFEDRQKARELSLDLFWKLPLWLDLPGLRVVHAAWVDDMLAKAKTIVDDQNCLTQEGLIQASSKDTPAYAAVEVLLKGPEASLPSDIAFPDKDGHMRDAVRTRWWLNTTPETTFGDVALGAELPQSVRDQPFKETLPSYAADDKPLFLGHYWFKGDSPEPVAPNVAIVDYSVAKKGKLVAYRFDGERELSRDKFISVPPSGD